MQKCVINCYRCKRKICPFCEGCLKWEQLTELLKDEKNPGNCSHFLTIRDNALDYCAPSILARHFVNLRIKELEETSKRNEGLIKCKNV